MDTSDGSVGTLAGNGRVFRPGMEAVAAFVVECAGRSSEYVTVVFNAEGPPTVVYKRGMYHVQWKSGRLPAAAGAKGKKRASIAAGQGGGGAATTPHRALAPGEAERAAASTLPVALGFRSVDGAVGGEVELDDGSVFLNLPVHLRIDTTKEPSNVVFKRRAFNVDWDYGAASRAQAALTFELLPAREYQRDLAEQWQATAHGRAAPVPPDSAAAHATCQPLSEPIEAHPSPPPPAPPLESGPPPPELDASRGTVNGIAAQDHIRLADGTSFENPASGQGFADGEAGKGAQFTFPCAIVLDREGVSSASSL